MRLLELGQEQVTDATDQQVSADCLILARLEVVHARFQVASVSALQHLGPVGSDEGRCLHFREWRNAEPTVGPTPSSRPPIT